MNEVVVNELDLNQKGLNAIIPKKEDNSFARTNDNGIANYCLSDADKITEAVSEDQIYQKNTAKHLKNNTENNLLLEKISETMNEDKYCKNCAVSSNRNNFLFLF